MYKVGDKVSNFELLDSEQKLVNLDEFKGKWVILYFYPKDNTPGCTNEACDFTDSLNYFKSADAIIIGVSPDKPSSHLKFVESYSLKIKLLCDTDKQVMKEFGAYGEKVMYGKKTMGVIRSTFIISPKGIIEEAFYNVKVRVKRASGEIKHSEIVLKCLKELQKARL